MGKSGIYHLMRSRTECIPCENQRGKSFKVEGLLDDPWPLNESRKGVLESFLSSHSDGCRYILGRNSESESVAREVRISGVVDDFSAPGTKWNGIPVLPRKDVPQDGIAINCSTSICPVSAAGRLETLDIAGTLPYVDLCRFAPERFPIPGFVSSSRQDILDNRSSWQSLFDRLADVESQRILADLIRFRASGDPKAMLGYTNRPREQYFEEFLGFHDQESFVDAGGYDGDTTEGFIRCAPGYRKVYLFEPSASNIEKARRRLLGCRDIEFIQKGVSDQIGTLAFDPDAGSASAVQEEGDVKISATTIDEEILEPVSYIKMDLEGWELQALAGAQQHIREDHPKLAISVYHKPEDFHLVPKIVLGYQPRYEVYLRHYTEGWSETIMYFVPC